MIGYANLQLNDFDITLGSGDDSERSGAYLCFGKQQWGSSDGAQNNFPIPFSTCLNLQQWQWDSSSMNNSGVVNNIRYDDTGYTYNGKYQLKFLAVGIAQQWGYIQTPNSSTTVDLNIPYTAAHYACFAQKADGKSGNAVEAWAGITAISLTNFTIRTHYDNTNYFLSCGQ